MKILLQGMYFYPVVGGMEVHILNLAKYFVKKNHSVIVITSNSMNTKKYENYLGIKIRRTPFLGKNIIGWILTTLFSIRVFLKNAKKNDIIHCHDIAAILLGVLSKKKYNKPFILTLHSSHYIRLSKKRIFRWYFKWGISKADYILAASKEIRNITKEIVPNREVISFVNPVDTELFFPDAKRSIKKDKDEFILVCPRRIVEKNGVHILIEAMPKIIQKYKGVKLYIAGDGPLKTQIKKRITDLRLDENITLLGSIPNEKMPELFSSADLIIMPSLMEATSIAALEALSSGTPVAASNVGGLPEIIKNEYGFLMEPGNIDSISQVIIKALSNISKLKKMGKIARETVLKKWSADKLTDFHLDIYKKFI